MSPSSACAKRAKALLLCLMSLRSKTINEGGNQWKTVELLADVLAAWIRIMNNAFKGHRFTCVRCLAVTTYNLVNVLLSSLSHFCLFQSDL